MHAIHRLLPIHQAFSILTHFVEQLATAHVASL